MNGLILHVYLQFCLYLLLHQCICLNHVLGIKAILVYLFVETLNLVTAPDNFYTLATKEPNLFKF